MMWDKTDARRVRLYKQRICASKREGNANIDWTSVTGDRSRGEWKQNEESQKGTGKSGKEMDLRVVERQADMRLRR
jgi:hypothetical protein